MWVKKNKGVNNTIVVKLLKGEKQMIHFIFSVGLFLENYVQEDLGNTSVTVLAGEILVQLVDRQENYTLGVNQSIQVIFSQVATKLNSAIGLLVAGGKA